MGCNNLIILLLFIILTSILYWIYVVITGILYFVFALKYFLYSCRKFQYHSINLKIEKSKIVRVRLLYFWLKFTSAYFKKLLWDFAKISPVAQQSVSRFETKTYDENIALKNSRKIFWTSVCSKLFFYLTRQTFYFLSLLKLRQTVG